MMCSGGGVDASGTLHPEGDVEGGPGSWKDVTLELEGALAVRLAQGVMVADDDVSRPHQQQAHEATWSPQELHQAEAPAPRHAGPAPEPPREAAAEAGTGWGRGSGVSVRLSYRLVGGQGAPAAPHLARSLSLRRWRPATLPLFGGRGQAEVSVTPLPRTLLPYGHGGALRLLLLAAPASS